MGKFLVFLSSGDEDVLVKNESIKSFLNELAPKGCTIEFIRKHENVLMAKEDMDYFKGSSIYVVDTHKGIDNITYWELGYAMGSGLKVIGYYDGKSDKRIPPDVERLINMPIETADDVECIKHFKTMIYRAFGDLKPKEHILKEDWNTQHAPARKEGGAT